MSRKDNAASVRRTQRLDGEARWEEILEKVGAIFYQKGYEATSLRDVATAVGLHKGSIYYYINTKEDLLYELVTRAIDLYLDTLEEDAETAAGPAPERLRAFIGRWMTLTAKDREWSLVAEREFRRLSPRRLRAVIAKRDVFSSFVKGIIGQGIQEGVFDPDVDLSVATTAVFELMVSSHQWHRPTGPLTMKDVGDWYATFAIRGLGGPNWSASRPARATTGSKATGRST